MKVQVVSCSYTEPQPTSITGYEYRKNELHIPELGLAIRWKGQRPEVLPLEKAGREPSQLAEVELSAEFEDAILARRTADAAINSLVSGSEMLFELLGSQLDQETVASTKP